jgi:hypothetical protein
MKKKLHDQLSMLDSNSRRWIVSFLIFAALPGNGWGQNTLVPSNNSFNTMCSSGSLKDHAGNSDYSSNARGYTRITGFTGAQIRIQGSYTTESGYDRIRIYNGALTLPYTIDPGNNPAFTLQGSGTFDHTFASGNSVTVYFSSDGSINFPGFDFNVTYIYTGTNLGLETAAATLASGCSNGTVPLGSGAYKDITIQANTYYNFTAPASFTNADAMVITPLNGTGNGGNLTLTAGQSSTAWFSGTTTSLRVSSRRTGTCWSATSASLTYRHTQPNTATAIAASSSFCEGGSTTITGGGGANGTLYWQGTTSNGTSTSTNVNPQSVSSAGSYYWRANNNGCWGNQGVATVTVNPNLPASVSISASASTICAGTSVTFTATPTNGGASPSYQWQVNNANVGANSATFTSTSLTNNDIVRVVMTSNASPCLTGSPATSNLITMTVSAPPSAGTLSGSQSVCTTGTTTLASTVTGGAWSSSNTAIATINGSSGVVTGVAAGTATMTYTVTGTGGCSDATATREVSVNPIVAPSFTQVAPVCSGATLNALPITSNNSIAGMWSPAVNNTATTTYTFTPNAGQCASIATMTVTVNTESTPITILSNPGSICPNTNTDLNASGGVAGTGSTVNWYTGPNGTGSLVGTGTIVTVAPTTNTTYYVRREGTCNTTTDASVTVNVKNFVCAANGASSNTYCTDNSGWNHFYNGDDIIFSVQGDLSGAPSGYPIASIAVNNAYYQQTQGPGTAAGCSSNQQPGEERFEMERSWNVDMGGGTPNGTYNIRFYYQPEERTAIEDAAVAWLNTYPSCGYSYKYNASSNGFFWFKNSGSNYVAPMYENIQYSATVASTSDGINYAEWTGINGFSGGSGAIILQPITTLPVELIAFTSECNNEDVAVKWSTASEFNSQHYVLQVSEDGYDWSDLYVSEAAGFSTTVLEYSYIHKNAARTKNYYRLRQYDNDGTVETYNTILSNCTSDENVFMTFPNPSADAFTVVVNDKLLSGANVLNISDASGKLIYSIAVDLENGSGSFAVEGLDLPAGLYYLQLNNGSYASRIIKHSFR